MPTTAAAARGRCSTPEHQGIEPREFFQAMRSLPPGALLKRWRRHRVDPNDEDPFAPPQRRSGGGGFAGSPYLLTGLNFLGVNGMDLHGV